MKNTKLAKQLITAAIEVLAAEVNPDKYKQEHGKCPKGMHTDEKTGKCRDLHSLAKEGQTGVLGHPDVATLKDSHGETALHHMARFNPSSKDAESFHSKVMAHPMFSKAVNQHGETPLHISANDISKSNWALNHHDVGTVKDNQGNTPLHNIANAVVNSLDDGEFDRDVYHDVKNHPGAKVKNNSGETPSGILKEVKQRG